jgi:hypothetical protein
MLSMAMANLFNSRIERLCIFFGEDAAHRRCKPVESNPQQQPKKWSINHILEFAPTTEVWGELLNRTYRGVISVYCCMSRSEETAGTDGSGRARYPLLWGDLGTPRSSYRGSLVAQFHGQDPIQQEQGFMSAVPQPRLRVVSASIVH